MNKISNKNKELPRHLTRCLLRVFSSLIVILALLITDAQAANTARAVLDMGHTKDAMIFPTGTTAERPEPPELGMIRFNTDLNMFEGYTKRGWVGLGTLTPTPGKVTGKCGSANGSIVAKEPTTNLCETGTLSIVTPDRGAYMWSCLGSGGGEHAACLALRQENGTCGITQTNNQAIDMSSLNGGDLCSEGRLTAAGVSDNPDTWTWTCRGTNGGTSIDCTLSKAITGVCGSASGVTVTAAPTANLCSVGTASGVTTNTTTYTWSCTGMYGGNNVNCSAPRMLAGACGVGGWVPNWGAITATSYYCNGSNICGYACSVGTFVSRRSNSNCVAWNCQGVNGGATSVKCRAWGSGLPCTDCSSYCPP